jgi:hypothetical protein
MENAPRLAIPATLIDVYVNVNVMSVLEENLQYFNEVQPGCAFQIALLSDCDSFFQAARDTAAQRR